MTQSETPNLIDPQTEQIIRQAEARLVNLRSERRSVTDDASWLAQDLDRAINDTTETLALVQGWAITPCAHEPSDGEYPRCNEPAYGNDYCPFHDDEDDAK